MRDIPETCKKCGAPIKWDKSSSYIDCNYCGKTNYIDIGIPSKVKHSIKNAKISSASLFNKVKRLSTSLFSKAKEASSNFLGSNNFKSNKKVIFILPLVLLSVVLVGRHFRQQNIELIQLRNEGDTNAGRCKNFNTSKTIYIDGYKFDNRFLGIWKNDRLRLEICIKNGKFNYRAWDHVDPEEFRIISINWTGKYLKVIQIMPSTNWKTVNKLFIEDTNSIKNTYTYPNGGSSQSLFKRN